MTASLPGHIESHLFSLLVLALISFFAESTRVINRVLPSHEPPHAPAPSPQLIVHTGPTSAASLPRGPAEQLRSRLEELCAAAGFAPGSRQGLSPTLDSALELPAMDDELTELNSGAVNSGSGAASGSGAHELTEGVREAALVFMCQVLEGSPDHWNLHPNKVGYGAWAESA